MNVGQAFVTHFQTSKSMQPCNGAFDDPACLAQPTAMCGSPLGQQRCDAQVTQCVTVGSGIVGTIALDAIWTLPWTPTLARYLRDSHDQGNKLGYIMGIGRRERRCERDAPRIADEVMFAACFASVRGIGSGFFPPCMARTEELSTMVRDHSICPAARSRTSNTRCTRAHTPARCHATKRRQQLTPEPHPISSGNAAHGMPVRSTNRMPVSACRWVMGLRPGCTRRRRFVFGSSGSMSFQSASSRIGFGMNILRHRESIHVEK